MIGLGAVTEARRGSRRDGALPGRCLLRCRAPMHAGSLQNAL